MDAGVRDLGAFVPGGRSEPKVPPLALAPSPRPAGDAPPAVPPPASEGPRTVFAGDLTYGPDMLGFDAPVAHLAELACHRGTAVPLCIGLLGGPGSGKSFSLRRLTDRVGEIARAAAGGNGPFLSRIHVQAIDAGSLDGEPMAALAAEIQAGLRQPYPALARDLGHTARDPHLVARETGEKLDEARRRLDAERRTLDESGSRLARLTETVLYEAAGSQVDAYARANRGRLENRLAAFGIAGEPVGTFKNLVRVVAEGGSPLGLSLRALYAFKGQTRLLVFAILAVLAGVGLGIAAETQDAWLGDLRAAGPQAAGAAATWIEGHMDLLAPARKAAFALAALLVAANLWRAFGFVQPILTGTRLLKADLAGRRRDLDGLYAHQTKRVDELTADVERLARASAEAERRLGEGATPHGMSEMPLFEPSARTQAQNMVLALGQALRGGAGEPRPQRIVLAVDHLDALAPERARAILDALHRVARATGLVTAVALDPGLVKATPVDLDRWIQLPLRLDAKREDSDGTTALVLHALGRAVPAAPAREVDAARSALDAPVGDDEAGLLAALAPLAGGGPRTTKRLVARYALARLDAQVPRGALALMLALDQGGTPAERQVVGEAMAGDARAAPFEPRPTTDRLRAGIEAARALDGDLTRAKVAEAAARASLFSTAAPRGEGAEG